MGPVRIRHCSHHFATQSSHTVDRAGWQAKMASIEFWIPWHNVHKPHRAMLWFSYPVCIGYMPWFVNWHLSALVLCCAFLKRPRFPNGSVLHPGWQTWAVRTRHSHTSHGQRSWHRQKRHFGPNCTEHRYCTDSDRFDGTGTTAGDGRDVFRSSSSWRSSVNLETRLSHWLSWWRRPSLRTE